MVIIIEPELEFDEFEPGEAPTSIGGGLSLLASLLLCIDLLPEKSYQKNTQLLSPMAVPHWKY